MHAPAPASAPAPAHAQGGTEEDLAPAVPGEGAGGWAQRRGERLQQLAAHEASRQAAAEQRRAQAQQQRSPAEDSTIFLAGFRARSAELQDGLRQAEGAGPRLASALAALEHQLAEAAYFLPQYDLRRCQNELAGLTQQLGAAREELAPKAKFSFSGKKGRQEPVKQGVQHPGPKQLDQGPEPPTASLPVRGEDHQALVEARQNAVILLRADQLKGQDVNLKDLVNCQVFILGTVSALFIRGIANCQIHAGPVQGAVHVHTVQDSHVMLAAHQVRIHDSKQTDFYLRVRSRPMIEHSTAVRFGPYAFTYPGIARDMEAASLSEESLNWQCVDDFSWLRAVQSPNWSIIPDSQHASVVDGSLVLEGPLQPLPRF